VGEILGVAAAMLSSGLGGTAVVATRFVVGACDPLILGAFRFGIGVLFLLPMALIQGTTWPSRRDWPAVAGLGLLFFGLFPILFNASLVFTTAARGSLALSTLPLLTLIVGSVLGVERLTVRKTTGVLVAMTGVAIALLSGLSLAPAAAWLGDLLMVGAALCMALYSVLSKPFIRRSGAIPFTASAMAVGALCLVVVSCIRGGFASVAGFGTPQWLAIAYLGLFGSAVTFFLWAFALGRTTPTRVAISVTVNPVMASLVGVVILHEPISWNLVVGLTTVVLGIWIATTVRGATGPS
jgi:drug/metabolite transporter (DMT)-like permease